MWCIADQLRSTPRALKKKNTTINMQRETRVWGTIVSSAFIAPCIGGWRTCVHNGDAATMPRRRVADDGMRTMRVMPTCRTRASGRRDRKRKDDRDDKKARAKKEDDLTGLFQEDVQTRLRAGREPAAKRSGKRSKAGAKRGAGVDAKVLAPISSLSKSLARSVPTNGEETLNLLVRVAWFGVFALFGLFVTVHLVIVRDWLPK